MDPQPSNDELLKMIMDTMDELRGLTERAVGLLEERLPQPEPEEHKVVISTPTLRRVLPRE